MTGVLIDQTTSEGQLDPVPLPLLETDRVFITRGTTTYRGELAVLLAWIADNLAEVDLSGYVTISSIVNVLTSTLTNAPASANTVKQLKDLIDGLTDSLANKLDLSAYVQHYRGKYASLVALQAAIPSGNDGDYAIVDIGAGNDAVYYIWDAQDGWVSGGTISGSTTDDITEGASNLYFNQSRVRATSLTGLDLSTNAVIGIADSVLSALGKLQKQISDLIPVSKTENFTIACSDRSTAITTGTNKMSFRNVGARKLNSVRASLDTAGTATATAIDINVNGTSIFTTTLTIDATEETSVDAVTPFVFKATSHSGWSGSPNYQIDDNAKISIDFDAVGAGAKGLDVAFLTERV